MKRFIIDHDRSDMDRRIYIREFSGRMTPERLQRLIDFCEEHTWVRTCGHEHDCCGCKFEQRMNVSYKQNQVIITLTEYFNY